MFDVIEVCNVPMQTYFNWKAVWYKSSFDLLTTASSGTRPKFYVSQDKV